jgi:hypothetical protein
MKQSNEDKKEYWDTYKEYIAAKKRVEEWDKNNPQCTIWEKSQSPVYRHLYNRMARLYDTLIMLAQKKK